MEHCTNHQGIDKEEKKCEEILHSNECFHLNQASTNYLEWRTVLKNSQREHWLSFSPLWTLLPDVIKMQRDGI